MKMTKVYINENENESDQSAGHDIELKIQWMNLNAQNLAFRGTNESENQEN